MDDLQDLLIDLNYQHEDQHTRQDELDSQLPQELVDYVALNILVEGHDLVVEHFTLVSYLAPKSS